MHKSRRHMKVLPSILGMLLLSVFTSISAQQTGQLRFINSGFSPTIAYQDTTTNIFLQITDSDRNLNVGATDQLTVSVSSTTEGTPESIILTETGINTGVFRGSITVDTVNAPSSDSVLQLKRGDALFASYDDPQDDFGNPLTLNAKAYYVVTYISGNITNDTTLSLSLSPYLVTGDITVDYFTTLTIEAGVEVVFAANSDDQFSGENSSSSELYIYGNILAIGTETDSIFFSSSSYTPTINDWYGIVINNTDSINRFEYISVSHANYGIYARDSYNQDDTLTIVNSRFNEVGSAIYIQSYYSDAIIENNRIENASTYGVYAQSYQSSIRINNNYVTNIDSYGIYCYNYDSARVNSNTVEFINGYYGLYLEYNAWTQADGNYVSDVDGDALYLSYADYFEVSNNEFYSSTNNGVNLYSAHGTLSGNTISNNNRGIYVYGTSSNPTIDSIVNNTITNNLYGGIEISNYGRVIAHYNNIFNNSFDGSYFDFMNLSSNWDQDARYNFWGDSTTIQMDTSANPTNIQFIYDQFDDPQYGFVNYSLWLACDTCESANNFQLGEVTFTDNNFQEVQIYSDTSTAVYLKLADVDQNLDTLSNDQVTITLKSSKESTGESVTLTESGPNSSVFIGSIPIDTVNAVSADGQLQVDRGDRLTVQYEDPLDEFGNPDTITVQSYYVLTLLSGNVVQDTTLSLANSPYLLTGDLTIDYGYTLTIEPGVEVIVASNQDDQLSGRDINSAEIFVLGNMIAQGNSVDSIYFSSAASVPSQSDWYGIVIENTDSINILSYLSIAHATYGISPGNSYNYTDSLFINNSTIKNSGSGIYLQEYYSPVSIENNVLYDIGGYGIYAQSYQSQIEIINNQLSNIGDYGIYCYYFDSANIAGNSLQSITGYYGIYAEYNQLVQVSDNYIDGVSGIGLYLSYSDNSEVSNNQIINADQEGITLYRAATTVTNNIIQQNGRGIYVYTDFNKPVVDSLFSNTITNNLYGGIEVTNYGRVVANYNSIYDNHDEFFNYYDFL